VLAAAETNLSTELKSSNNNLASISIDGLAISSFNKNTLTYKLETVENSKTSINITAVPEDAKSTITGVGIKTLTAGNNSFNIVVTAENGMQKTYTINVERQAASNEEQIINEPEKKTPEELPSSGISEVIFGGIVIMIIVAVIGFINLKKLSGV